MKPANFPMRKRLRQVRANLIQCGIVPPPRGFDQGREANATLCVDTARLMPEVK